MKVLKILGIILAAILVILVVIGLVTPKHYDIKREVVINAPAHVIFENISRYENFPKWSPWQHLDTAMKTTLEGEDATVGAKYSWVGNSDVGEGSMTITKIETGKMIEQDLRFLKPFESNSTTYMTIEPAEGGNKVTWGMKGESGFVPRIMMTMMGGMDGAVGKDYEKGLANLKALCESAPTASAYEVKEFDWTEKNALSIRKVVAFTDLNEFFTTHYPKMSQALAKVGARPGTPMAVYYDYDEKDMKADVAAAIPFEGRKVSSTEYATLNLPAAKSYTIDYYGDYDKIPTAYETMNDKLTALGKDHPEMVIEEYVTDPTVEKDTAKWNTRIYFFVK
jgi:effector-binding domain-containing protein